jgi:hypothetical protein
VYPLSNLVATEQVETGDFVTVGFDSAKDGLTFRKQTGKMIISDTPEDVMSPEPLVKSDAVGAPLPQTQAATGMSKSKGERNDV